MRGANMENPVLHKAQLTVARIMGANLGEADLFDGELSGIRIRGTNLTNSILVGPKS